MATAACGAAPIHRMENPVEFDLTQSLDVLARTPAVLAGLLGDADPAWLTGTEGPDTWSPADVLGHMLHCEETDWVPRARIILEHGESVPFTPLDRQAQFHRYAGWSIGQLLDRFAEQRAANLISVRGWSLTPEQLALRGTHPAFGAVTLRQLLATWTVHDLGHIAQITRVMAKQYAEQVGPWSAYLSVLHR